MIARAVFTFAVLAAAPATAQNFATSATPEGERPTQAPAVQSAQQRVIFRQDPDPAPTEDEAVSAYPAPEALNETLIPPQPQPQPAPAAPAPVQVMIDPAPARAYPNAAAPTAQETTREPFRAATSETDALLQLSDEHAERLAAIDAALTTANEMALTDAQAAATRPNPDIDAIRAVLRKRIADAEADHAIATANEAGRYQKAQLDLLASGGG